MDVRITNAGYEVYKKYIREQDEEIVEGENEEVTEADAKGEELPAQEERKNWRQEKLDEQQVLVKSLIKFTEQVIAASKDNTVKEETLKYKKSIVDNMLKTLRALNARNYTRDSYKKCMANVQKAVAVCRSNELTNIKLNQALNYLRSAMMKLEPAKSEDEKGKYRDLDQTFSKEARDVQKFLKENGIYIGNEAIVFAAPVPPAESATDFIV